MHAVIAMAPAPGSGGSGGMITIGYVVFMGLIFYFWLIAPQRSKAKKHAAMLDALKSGDKVVTSGGIYGTVTGVDDTKVQLKIANQVTIEVAKAAIAGSQPEA